MKKKENSKLLWYLTAIGFVILFILMLLSSILDVGDRLRAFTIGGIAYFEYAFYIIVALLVYILIIRPINIILFSPSFNVETTIGEEKTRNYPLYKKVTKRLLASDILSSDMRLELETSLSDHVALREALNHAFNTDVKKAINKVIQKNAKTVMVSTTISQNGKADFIAVFVINIKMIKEIVEMCGFRPSFRKLAKLTVNVGTTALIAEGLEEMDISELMPQSPLQTVADMPFVGTFVSSVSQGVSNALLTLRVGIVTRKYLFTDAEEITKEKIRRDALLEAAKLLPIVVGEAALSLPKKFMNIFKKQENANTK